MLTSSSNNSNQYLRPEYLTPLPTTLDAKKSPLALLAQTCSQIGADPPNNTSTTSTKSSLLNSNNSSTSSSGSSSNSHHEQQQHNSLSKSKSLKSHHHHAHHQDFHEKHRKQQPSSSVSPLINIDNNNKSSLRKSEGCPDLNVGSSSIFSSVTITNNNNSNSDGPRNSYKTCQSSKAATTPNPGNASPNNNSSSSSATTSCCSSTNPTNKSPSASISPVTCSATTAADSASSTSKIIANSHHESNNQTSCSTTTTSNSNTSCTPSSVANSSSTFNKLNLSNSLLPNALSSTSSIDLALKHGFPFPSLYPPHSSSNSMGTGIPPYLHSYARLKAAAANVTNSLDPLLSLGPFGGGNSSATNTGGCRDPFCNGCQLGQHLGLGLKAACPAGCSQCDHHFHHNKNPFLSPFGFPFLPGFPFPQSLAGLYSNHHSSTSPAAMQPYICNWIVGDSYCGKRFGSSEELLQHLRTHTSLASLTTTSSGSGSTQEAMQNLAAAAAAGYLPFSSHHHPGHPLLASTHSLLSRTYPTPPLSPPGSTRFHPYSKAGTATSSSSSSTSSFGLNGGLGSATSTSLGNSSFMSPSFQGLAHPALSPYYPYSLYSQRLLGASASSMHP